MSASTLEQTERRGIPLSVRLLDRISSPILAAATIAVVLVAGYLLGELATGRLQLVSSGAENSLGIRATATLFVLAAYIPVAHLFLRRWTGQHLATLRASFGDAITFEHSASASVLAGLLGAAAFLALFIVVPIILTGVPEVSFQLAAATIGGTAFGWLAGRFSVCMARDSLRMSVLARSLPDIDLLDLGAVSPFVQQGLRGALLTIMVPVLSLHLSVAPGNRVIAAAVYLSIWCALTIVAFTLPVQGIHDRICKEKQSLLVKLRAEIREAKEQVVDRRSETGGERLSALLDMEIRLERVREWPYDASSWRRLALYLLLGLGSWVGAATVERLLDLSF